MKFNLQIFFVNHSIISLFFLYQINRRMLFRALLMLLLTTQKGNIMTILITGATGNIGTQLTKELTAKGASFYLMTSKPSDALNTRVASFNDVSSLTKAFTGIKTLFVLLPLVANKLDLARNVATAAKAAGVQHIVRSSGAGADPESGFALPRLQGKVDEILSATGIQCTFLRPAGFMQNYATFQAGQVKAGLINAAHGDAHKSMVDVRDIAAVAATILINPSAHAGKVYTLTSNDSLTENESVAILSAAIGKTVRYEAISNEEAITGMKQWGLPPEIIDAMASLNQIIAAGYAAGTTGDVQALLGRAPISFTQFAKDYAGVWTA
jgi:uncharacterized protein YbjT (DUF2867 family)